MGRWAQARRTGGGQEETGTALFMVSAVITDTQEITITLNKDFAIGDAVPVFIAHPSLEGSAALVQTGDRELEVGFAAAITGSTSISIDDGGGLFTTGEEIAIS